MITLLIGYLASTAAVALVAGNYVEQLVPGVDPRIVATLLLLGLGAVHAITVIGGSRLNDLLVLVKVAVVLLIVVAGFWTEFTTGIETILPSAAVLEAARLADPGGLLASIPAAADAATVEAMLRDAPAPSPFSAACGAAVIAITFAYLGWSNASDVAGEVTRPGRNVPFAVIGSVLLVGTLYLLANVVYLWAVPPAAMVEVASDGGLKPMTGLGSVVAVHLFGERGGWIITAAIVVLMASTLSVGIMTCGRVIAAMAWKGELPRAAGSLNRRGAPTAAIVVQIAVAIAMVWISGIRSLLEYVGVLTTFAVILTMLAAIMLRVRRPDEPRPFRMPLYPLPPLVAIAVGGWIVVTSAIADWRPPPPPRRRSRRCSSRSPCSRRDPVANRADVASDVSPPIAAGHASGREVLAVDRAPSRRARRRIAMNSPVSCPSVADRGSSSCLARHPGRPPLEPHP